MDEGVDQLTVRIPLRVEASGAWLSELFERHRSRLVRARGTTAMLNIDKILLCTLGTSLLTNIRNGDRNDAYLLSLKAASEAGDWKEVARLLHQIPNDDRRCGAEINSISGLIQRGVTTARHLVLLHSDTDEGAHVAAILTHYYEAGGARVESRRIEGLLDSDPEAFRSRGLRTLASTLCRWLRDYGAGQCAINATGGYKAQVAVAVLLGQAFEVPVYYKHERFNLIIDVPPMPVSLDFDLWLEQQEVFALLRGDESVPAAGIEIPPRMEALLDRISIDGVETIALNYLGEIFDQTFLQRAPDLRALPPAVPAEDKRPPVLTEHNYDGIRPGLERYLRRVTETPYVVLCRGHYNNPDLARKNIFRMTADGIEGIYSNGTGTVKFIVETHARNHEERRQAVLDLNRRLERGEFRG